MDDLADVVGSALGAKKPRGNPPAGAGIVAPSEQMPDTYSGSPGDIADAKKAIASAPNTPEGRAAAADLERMISGGSDLADTVKAAISEAPQLTPAPQKQPEVKPTEERSRLASFGAGAGKAVGSGVLGLQQLAGKGTEFLGDVTGSDTLKSIGGWLAKDAREGALKLEAENKPYEEANPKTNFAGGITGAVLSPVNKLVPGMGTAASVGGAAIRGAAQGAILNTLTAPVTDETKPFLLEKAKQGAVGAVGGTLGGVLGYSLSKGINSAIDATKRVVNRVTSGNPSAVADEVVEKTLQAQGLSKENVTPELFDGLKSQVAEAVKSGKAVDEAALVRLASAQTLPVPVPMLKGQITRDAMQFAKEQNLRGIQGVGEPITETLQSQNRALIKNLDALGADKGADVLSAGKNLISPLTQIDSRLNKGVGDAYKAFENATGKELDVPLGGLAQDYARILKERGSSIPAEVKREFESFGLLGGKQLRSMSISDAEGLIKNYINKNYDPSNRVAAGALDDLRRAVEKSIETGAGKSAEGGPAAQLALAARRAARDRFSLIDSTPALKDVVRGVEPDKFIQKHILQGNESEIRSMVKLLQKEEPKALESLQDAVMAHVKREVLNKASSENGKFSQAKLKNFVEDPNMAARLAQVLGPEKMGTLKQLNKVAEDALYDPVAAAVNRSNTTSAAANLVKSEVQGGTANKALELAKRVPGLSSAAQMAQQGVQSSRASKLIDEAVNPSLAKQAGSTSAQDLTGLGARAGSSYTGAQSRKRAQQ